MIRVMPFLVELALLIFCLIDAIQTPESEVRNLPKWGWIVLIIIVPLVGGIAWLVVGRPTRATRDSRSEWAPGSGFPEQQRPQRSTREIDERLDADLARLDREHEESLKRWEAELRERERRISGNDDGDAPTRP